MTPLRIVFTAATLIAFQPLAGAEELTPATFLRGDAPDERVWVTVNAGVSYYGVILLDYADGWARIFYTKSYNLASKLSEGANETWIQASNISAIRFPSSLEGETWEEKRAAALELKKKLKEEAAARQKAELDNAAGAAAQQQAAQQNASAELIRLMEKAAEEKAAQQSERRRRTVLPPGNPTSAYQPEAKPEEKPEEAPAPAPEADPFD